ncbi:MAG: L(+)-tartrate dehydratase subunit alpha [Nitrososphaeria archaeon]|nr:L(+)-tartrate dehydratase subunit alpha [Nitrososphaeria archaeon]
MDALVRLLSNFIRTVAIRLPDDVLSALKELSSKESSYWGKAVYSLMFDNINLALEKGVPVCQDTGVLMFFIDVGTNFPYVNKLYDALKVATIKATEEVPLRPNVVEPFDEKNTGNNVGTRLPWIEWNIVPEADYVEITLYLAGGGTSLTGNAKVLPPASGFKGVIEFVLDVVSSYGLNACPPFLLGVGIGATVETAALLSKRALLRPIGSINPNPKAASLERILYEKVCGLEIGPQGLGGSTTVLGVNVEYSARHPATLAVGVSTGCWAHRRGVIKIKSDLTYELPLYKGVVL